VLCQEAEARYRELEAENRDFADRYLEAETENNSLLNLYVASYQLHSTLDFDEVLRIIAEIVLNFVGAEVFAVAMRHEKKNVLLPIIAQGIEADRIRDLSLETGVAAEVFTTGAPTFSAALASSDTIDPAKPTACVPLRIKGSTFGVLLIYRFLQQKTELAGVDKELFTLLAGHAATAIFSSRLYADSQRKLNTIQGLIDLVTS